MCDRFVKDGFNVILDTEEERYYEAMDSKSAEKLVILLNRLNKEKEEFKQLVKLAVE